MKWVAVGFALFVLMAFASGGVFPPTPAANATPGVPGPSAKALADIPPGALAVYREAGAQYGIRWAVLAAIGKVETNHCRSTAPGVHSGSNFAGAQGCMQFLASTWALPGIGMGGSPYVLHDAAFAAARYLVKSGAPGDYTRAVFSYNHADWYVAEVLKLADEYEAAVTAGGGAGGAAGFSFSGALAGAP